MLAFRALVRVLQALGLGNRTQVILVGASSMGFAFNAVNMVYDHAVPWPAKLMLDYSAGLAPCNWISNHMAYVHSAESIGGGFCLFDVGQNQEFGVTNAAGSVVLWIRCFELFAIWHIVAYYYGEDMLMSLNSRTRNMLKWMEEQHGYAANRVQVILSACCMLSVLAMMMYRPSVENQPQMHLFRADDLCLIGGIPRLAGKHSMAKPHESDWRLFAGHLHLPQVLSHCSGWMVHLGLQLDGNALEHTERRNLCIAAAAPSWLAHRLHLCFGSDHAMDVQNPGDMDS